jgi:FkbM family methyltransferase
VQGFQGARGMWERAWTAAAPVRWIVAHFPTQKGKGRLTWILLGIFADRRSGPDRVVLAVPTGAEILVDGATVIGPAAIAQGYFESEEVELMTRLCKEGTLALDVGANVGLFTVAFAQSVGPTGRVLAIEPNPPSIAQLLQNVDRNGLSNVTIVPMAVGATPGRGRLVGDDPAMIRVERETAGSEATVSVTTLDRLWTDLGRPAVSVIKIDVEGSEVSVLEGARELLRSGPALMVETRTVAEHEQTVRLLESVGYSRRRSRLETWNHVFQPNDPG